MVGGESNARYTTALRKDTRCLSERHVRYATLKEGSIMNVLIHYVHTTWYSPHII